MKPGISRAIGVVTTTFELPLAAASGRIAEPMPSRRVADVLRQGFETIVELCG
jgi:hypothetical protein